MQSLLIKRYIICCSQALNVNSSASNWTIAPITGNDMGVKRAEIRQGVREVVLCKDMDGKIGLRLKAIDNVRGIHKQRAYTTRTFLTQGHIYSNWKKITFSSPSLYM